MFTKTAVKRILEEILQPEERIKHTQGGTNVILEQLINTSLRKHYSHTKYQELINTAEQVLVLMVLVLQ